MPQIPQAGKTQRFLLPPALYVVLFCLDHAMYNACTKNVNYLFRLIAAFSEAHNELQTHSLVDEVISEPISAKTQYRKIQIFPEKELRGLSPNFHSYVL